MAKCLPFARISSINKFMDSILSNNYKKEFINHFKGEKGGNKKPRQTPGVFYSKTMPTPVKSVQLLGWSDPLAEELGIDKPNQEAALNIFGGNGIAPGMDPYAARYGGHQFGHWAGQLGDGRAITLGEWITKEGKSFELQLKGAGPTPYSRRADGRAVLRSSVREFLMSEAMHHLGIPTTRALSLVSTGDPVLRDMFYDGHPAYEPGAIVMRVAPSFLRFGNFEIFTATNEIENLKQLVNWTISKFYPHIEGENRIINWFSEVVDRTAEMIVEWMRVGFVHGVMNTDNMSILGLTIDYGPYSFLDDYDPSFTPNTTDLPGRRYAFGRQPSIGYWNLGCLANALVPLVKDIKELEKALHSYEDIFPVKYQQMMANKLGLDVIQNEDNKMVQQLEEMLATVKPDMTIFYRLLMQLPASFENNDAIRVHFEESFYRELSEPERLIFNNFILAYLERKSKNTITKEVSLEKMQKANPVFVLRNYLLHQAIERLENNDKELFNNLLEALQSPYSTDHLSFMKKRPEWASSKAGCSMLSCSS
jgi:serine/tyrosine/threonine adenylyltransferase